MGTRLSHSPAAVAGEANRGFRRAISLLKELSSSRRCTANLTQLANAAGLPKPTVHRLLALLLEERLIERVPETRHFRLGPLAYELGLAARRPVDIREACAPALERVATASGDAAFLNARSGTDALCLDRREGSFAFQAVPVEVGNRRPLGVGAASLAVLSTLAPDSAEAIVAANEARYPRYRLTADKVLGAVATARARGFAVTSGCLVASFSGVAVAIDSPNEQEPLALSIITLTERLKASRIDKAAALLRREARAAGEALAVNTPVTRQDRPH